MRHFVSARWVCFAPFALAQGFFACSGSSSSAHGTGGSPIGGGNTGGAATSSTGGSGVAGATGAAISGGTTSNGTTSAIAGMGGASSASSVPSAGGVPSTGGVTSVGGSKNTGGIASGGTSSVAGGGTTSVGRGAGICPGASYPTPDLSGAATVVASGNTGGQYEGTLWLSSSGALLFSDMNMSGSATTVVPAAITRWISPSTVSAPVADAGSNGLAIDFSGKVLGCSQKVQGIISVDLNAGLVSTLVNTDASGHHFNSPNDLTVRTDGTIYFTDPDYQIAGRVSETGIKGVYRISPSNQVSIVDGQFNQPNGVSLSPDETVLYVADTAASKIRRFAVAVDGTTSNKQDFASMPSPDGGAVDCAGNLYWASNAAPGKVVVFSPSGTQIGTISVGTTDKPTNVAFGGTDHKTLYISTSPRKIYSVTINIPGFPY